MPEYRYAEYPEAFVHKQADAGSKKVKHLLFGDWVRIEGDAGNGWLRVHCRGEDGFMQASSLRSEKVLEVVFVDIGQGDGCFVVTPADEMMVIDAGAGTNMARYLAWRFAGFGKPRAFDAAVVSHPDLDHYGGFGALFEIPNLTFKRLYSNGLVERAGGPALGATVKGPGGKTYQTDLVSTSADLDALVSDPAKRGGMRYPNMLFDGRAKFASHLRLGLDRGSDGKVRPDSAPFGWLKTPEMRIEVLGPVVDQVAGVPALRRLGSNDGVTKNGHSVVLKLVFKDVQILLGGDLNIPSENLLMEAHTGLESPAKTVADEERLIAVARSVFGCDIAKSCHHGSSDVSETFLKSVNPVATVISSGDDEPHGHPRCDTLGLVGRHSRGRKPLIFCTELARSGKEFFDLDSPKLPKLFALREKAKKLAKDDPELKVTLGEINDIQRNLGRAVATYGAIQLRTDGERVVMAYKLERKRGSIEWDTYRLEPDAAGRLDYVPRD